MIRFIDFAALGVRVAESVPDTRVANHLLGKCLDQEDSSFGYGETQAGSRLVAFFIR